MSPGVRYRGDMSARCHPDCRGSEAPASPPPLGSGLLQTRSKETAEERKSQDRPASSTGQWGWEQEGFPVPEALALCPLHSAPSREARARPPMSCH